MASLKKVFSEWRHRKIVQPKVFKTRFLEPHQHDSMCPDIRAKINSFANQPKSKQNPRCLVPLEGRIAIVTDAGRDAVDADALLTNSAEADGEVVWS
jgi:hypothetical protein